MARACRGPTGEHMMGWAAHRRVLLWRAWGSARPQLEEGLVGFGIYSSVVEIGSLSEILENPHTRDHPTACVLGGLLCSLKAPRCRKLCSTDFHILIFVLVFCFDLFSLSSFSYVP